MNVVVPVSNDPTPALGGYADPQRLVSTEWLSANIGNPTVKVVEANEDPLLYAIGHVPGALKIDWAADLVNPLTHDFVDGAAFAELMRAKGINRDDTVVFYGDNSNRWAAYMLWIFTLFGHRDLRLLDGGRDAWHNEGRETTLDLPWETVSDYPVVPRDDSLARVFRPEVAAGVDMLVDVRSPVEFAGKPESRPGSPAKTGHIPTARNIPWDGVLAGSGAFLPRADLEALYAGVGEREGLVLYCGTSERACHTWFVLTHLLGRSGVRVYDGSWTEWGNTVRAPISKGDV